jgi:hypothetical protein
MTAISDALAALADRTDPMASAAVEQRRVRAERVRQLSEAVGLSTPTGEPVGEVEEPTIRTLVKEVGGGYRVLADAALPGQPPTDPDTPPPIDPDAPPAPTGS